MQIIIIPPARGLSGSVCYNNNNCIVLNYSYPDRWWVETVEDIFAHQLDYGSDADSLFWLEILAIGWSN